MPGSTRSRALTSRAEAVLELERIESEGAFAGLSRRSSPRAGSPAADDAGEDDWTERGGAPGRAASLPDRASDEAKITDLVAGVTRWRRWLNFLVDHFYSGQADSLEPRLGIVLRIGMYELLLTREPDHAVVNEAVETARTMVGARATGLVNGILRAVVRGRDRLPEPESESEPDRLGILHSHPTWMVERWLRRYGTDDTIRLLEHDNERPSFGVRIRKGGRTEALERLESAGASPTPSPFFDDFIRMDVLRPLAASGLVADGAALVQDEAAGAVVRALDPAPGERILDACAAPGGKTFYIADRTGETGEITAVDRSASRLRLLDAEAARLGLSRIRTRVADFATLRPDDLGGPFDHVLLDSPCSGLGVLAKRADLRWRMTPERMEGLRELQIRLLNAAAGHVSPGGTLVYSTCTLEPEENEEISQVFLEENELFTLEHIDDESVRPFVTTEGYLVCLPFRHGIDGAFAARFRRRGG